MEAFAWPDDEEDVGSEYEADGVGGEGSDGGAEVAAEPEGEQRSAPLDVPASRDPPTRRLRRLRGDVPLAVACGLTDELQPFVRGDAPRAPRRCASSASPPPPHARRAKRPAAAAVKTVRKWRSKRSPYPPRAYAYTSDAFRALLRMGAAPTASDCNEDVLPHRWRAAVQLAKSFPSYDCGALRRVEKLRAFQLRPVRAAPDAGCEWTVSRDGLREKRFNNRMRARGGHALLPESRPARRVCVQVPEEEDAELNALRSRVCLPGGRWVTSQTLYGGGAGGGCVLDHDVDEGIWGDWGGEATADEDAAAGAALAYCLSSFKLCCEC